MELQRHIDLLDTGPENADAQASDGPLQSEGPIQPEESQSTTSVRDQTLEYDVDEEPEDEVEPSDEQPDTDEEPDEEPDTDEEPDILIPLPMPDTTGFEVLLPPELQPAPEEEASPNSEILPAVVAPVLAAPPRVIHVHEVLKPLVSGEPGPGFEGVQIAHIGHEAGLTGELQATYLCLPPGTRTSRPVAQRLGDSITYCISGRGLLWQNGWTFPFEATDAAGWKGGTGVAHTIINDSNLDGSPGQDLILITAHEAREGESFFFPLNPELDDAAIEAEGKTLWRDPPVVGEFGPHPGVASVSPERGNKMIPGPQQGYRPSNVINAIAELDAIGEGELFANATSLSRETGLSARFGCNFEVPPPGARSSDPHAHSLEDELVYIVSGHGLAWINGHVEPVCEGDAVGFPGGTGVAHNFINDSNATGSEGEPLILWIIGQNKRKEGDLVYYPLHIEEKSKSRRWWADCPRHELGPHNGRPQRALRL